jgi:hypothetical protein
VCTPLRTHRLLLEVFLKSNSLASSESNSQRNFPELETANVLVKCLSNAPRLFKDCCVSGVVLIYEPWKAGGLCWLHVATGRSTGL